jgi:hypothetical protein
MVAPQKLHVKPTKSSCMQAKPSLIMNISSVILNGYKNSYPKTDRLVSLLLYIQGKKLIPILTERGIKPWSEKHHL